MKKKNKYSMVNNVIYVYGEANEFMKKIIYLTLIEVICSIIIPVANVYLPKMAIDIVVANQNISRTMWIMLIFTIVMVIVYAIHGYTQDGKYMYTNMLRGYINTKIILKTFTCDYKFAESAKGQTMYERARNALARGDVSGSSVVLRASKEFIINGSCFVLYSGVISTLNPLVLVLCISMSAVNWFALKFARDYEIKQRDKKADISHRLYYIQRKVKEDIFAKDIRIYSMKAFILDIQKKLMNKEHKLQCQVEKKKYNAQIINAITLILRDGISYIYLIICVSNGSISVGDFVLYFGAITGFSGFVSEMVSNISELMDASSEISDVRQYIDYEDEECRVISCIEQKFNKELKQNKEFSIEFKNVNFSYDKNTKILDNFSMKIEAGTKVALVGVNGAGKTSIVKLMCGFYKVNSGEILINGMNINKMDRKTVSKLYSVVFQDITMLPLTIAENISMKCLEDTDTFLVDQCLKTVGLYDEVMEHKDGIKTYITNYFSEDGINLSGGQLQKLLMARALYKNGKVMIFDEPTAALDPIAEDEIYRKFREIIGGKTAVYISHRLSSTRFCDKIVLIKNGRVCEEGTHEFLMELHGEYRNMFDLQSQYYKDKAERKCEEYV
ncbi:ATP-binding cassette, subfamily C [Clostridium collagenovorans DSM 3089]|uniref:ATP-binding cassette, subfamily C n=1 Tax=Clostridium collagenovorans DSM 3089 TaxID=1121306 RepID=A0A1M5V8S9_9CLOT|nr:ABC transporter ATP-binding protein [Clostridium collagenovorans]SHH71343.1 ATP-binding cassette, subfamily C [Clostridium collagenovorans DSM 3089]